MALPGEINTDGENRARLKDRNGLRRFLRDVLVSAVVTFAATGALWGLIGSVDGLALWLYVPFAGVLPALIFGVPVLVVLFGVAKMRLGIAIGPTLLAAVLFTSVSLFRQNSDVAVRVFATQGLEPASRTHSVLAFEGNDDRCDIACIRILATLPYALAGKNDFSRDWVLFKRGEGDACLANDRWQSTLEFLEAGYRGMCAIHTSSPDIGDSLVARERHVSGSGSVAAGLPRAFTGTVDEISERIGGEERLLGRRLRGWLGWPVPNAIAIFGFGAKAQQYIDVGPKIDRKEFLAGAVGTPSSELYATALFSPAAILDEVESYFDRPAISPRAMSAWSRIASSQGKTNPEIVRPRLQRLLAGVDPDRIGTALSGLFGLPVAERAFAQDRIVELAFSPMIDVRDSPVLGPLKGHLAWFAEPFPAGIREQAKSRFVRDETLAIGRRQALFMIMVRGGSEMRREAVDTLFSLSGVPFETAVWAVGNGGSDIWARNEPSRWTYEEVQRLIERMAGVPNGRLKVYLDAFRFGKSASKEQKEALVPHIRQRLQAAESAAMPDDAEVKGLKRLIEAIPANLGT